MSAALATALCLASGYLVVASFWPQDKRQLPEQLVMAFLSLGFGIGIFSVIFFLDRMLGISHVIAVDLCVAAGLFVAFLVLRARSNRTARTIPAVADFTLPVWLRRLVTIAFTLSVLLALYAGILRALAHPHGEGWDAFAIWNLHARFLYLGGAQWREGFNALIPWSHPDYPLLIPAAVAHFWSAIGYDTPVVPAAIALVFTCATWGLLVSSLTLLRGWMSGMLAGIALASTPLFVAQGTSQYADVPLSFFVLASFALFHLYACGSAQKNIQKVGLLALAGIAAGFAAWTKNEGLLFLLAFLLVRLIEAIRQRMSAEAQGSARLSVAPLMLTTLPILFLIGSFKHFVAPAGDLFSTWTLMLQKILSFGRYWIILQWYGKEFLRFGHWIVPGTILLVVFYVLAAGRRNRQQETTLRSSVMIVVLTMAGYFAIYVITPYDLYWHLRFSLNRLFLQLWPAAVFLFFLYVGRLAPAVSQNELDTRPKSA